MCAVALSYAKEWLIDAHRPMWMINGVEVVELTLFITDGIVIVSVCLIIIKEVILELLGK